MADSLRVDFLDAQSAEYLAMVDELSLDALTTSYSVMDNDEFARILRISPRLGMKTYWQEILFRAHMSAVTAVLRSRRWLSALADARAAGNLLSLAAAFRGFIESVADSATSLGGVPVGLAALHPHIKAALSEKLDRIVVCKALEDHLIHFSHARYIPKQEKHAVPSSHQAETAKNYLKILEDGGVTDAMPCYRAMCNLVHPGAPSVHMWLEHQGNTGRLCSNREREIISTYTAEYKGLFLELLMFGFNPAVMTLGVLNYLPLRHLHTPRLEDWNLSGIPGWQQCLQRLQHRTSDS